MTQKRFEDISIVSCGTLSLELNHLKKEGFLDTPQILYTTPGLHQDIPELERQLVRQIERARQKTPYVIVVYGGKFCYVNVDQPTRLMQTIIAEQGPSVARIEATHCMDMIASEAERERIAAEAAGGEPVWWMTPGWIKFRKEVFKGWDKGLANENFPKHTGGAIILDGVGYMDTYMAEKPEDFLEYADWMGIPIIPWPVSLDRFKKLLLDQADKLHAAA
ncbi:conserved hypothetical protein [Desulfosarcina cetonica]|uniref:DUF1638 domain-containing protein n=1 Tax=Desulfosarcina cetonica TaxID=90730 RepID=UPI0006D0D6F2|nr:DUF1638 domain-containing protein [Desulfosarcina cetonica]VTR69180.1 conserved hypothetical protein [Desulfosarcina cetonica]